MISFCVAAILVREVADKVVPSVRERLIEGNITILLTQSAHFSDSYMTSCQIFL